MSDLFTRYRITIQMNHKIMGGVPRDPKVIEGWIRTKMEMEDGDDLRIMVARTMQDMGHEIGDDADIDTIDAAIARTAAEKQTNGFKRDEFGLYLETRCVKAMIKENVNILWGKERFGPSRKAGKGYVAERVFVDGDTIPLHRTEPDGVDLFIGHVTGPKGPQSTLTYYEYCLRPQLTFTILYLKDCLPPDRWEALWAQAEQNGLGSLRSQGFGRFSVLDVEPVATPKRRKFFTFGAASAPEEAAAD